MRWASTDRVLGDESMPERGRLRAGPRPARAAGPVEGQGGDFSHAEGRKEPTDDSQDLARRARRLADGRPRRGTSWPSTVSAAEAVSAAAVAEASAGAMAAVGGGFRGGYGGGYGGGMHYGGMSSFGRTPSFSSPGSFGRYGAGMSYGSRGAAEGMRGGQLDYGIPLGFLHTRRGAGRSTTARRGPAAGGREEARRARGVYGVEGTTAGGRSFADVGRAGGAVGPGGNAVAGRSNIGAVSGPRGTAVGGSRGASPRPATGGAVAGRGSLRGLGLPALRLQRLRGLSPGLGPRLLERPQLRGLGLAQPLLGRLGARDGARHGPGLGPVVLGLRLVPLRHGLHALLQPVL